MHFVFKTNIFYECNFLFFSFVIIRKIVFYYVEEKKALIYWMKVTDKFQHANIRTDTKSINWYLLTLICRCLVLLCVFAHDSDNGPWSLVSTLNEIEQNKKTSQIHFIIHYALLQIEAYLVLHYTRSSFHRSVYFFFLII